MILVIQFCGRAVGEVQQHVERQRRRIPSISKKRSGFSVERKGRDGSTVLQVVASESEGKTKSTREREQVQDKEHTRARASARASE
jgi:hypothetical protein